MMESKVSVVCAWYNRANYINDTIDSLLSQDYKNYEIIIVDDGSDDKEVKNRFDQYDDKKLHVIYQNNMGFTAAIRKAIEESDGEYIAIQGAGDVSFPTRLSRQVGFLKNNPGFMLVGCRYANKVIGGDKDGKYKLKKYSVKEPTYKNIKKRNPYGHGEIMMRRSVYDEIGGYRSFFKKAQDKDLILRISEKGRLYIISEQLYERRIFISDGIASDFKKKLQQIAYSRLCDKAHSQRKKKKYDDIDAYSEMALLSVPKNILTTFRIIKAIRYVELYGKIDFKILIMVKKMYGFNNYAIAVIFYIIKRILPIP